MPADKKSISDLVQTDKKSISNRAQEFKMKHHDMKGLIEKISVKEVRDHFSEYFELLEQAENAESWSDEELSNFMNRIENFNIRNNQIVPRLERLAQQKEHEKGSHKTE